MAIFNRKLFQRFPGENFAAFPRIDEIDRIGTVLAVPGPLCSTSVRHFFHFSSPSQREGDLESQNVTQLAGLLDCFGGSPKGPRF